LTLLAAAGFVELRDRRPRTGLFHASITARLLTLTLRVSVVGQALSSLLKHKSQRFFKHES
jgi:hypothetical protein